MTETTLYGLTDEQHRDVGRLVKSSRTTQRPGVVLPSGGVYPGMARVIAAGDDDLTYAPRTARDCVLFRWNPDGQQITVEMVGTNLDGDLVLSIDGTEYQIPCDATQDELRAIVTIPPQDCRVSVLHGFWEFDFNRGRWAQALPEFDLVPFEPPEDDTETAVFDGGLIVTTEAWVTETTSDGDTLATVETRDWMPFLSGAVRAGSIGGALWNHAAGWLVMAWQCRDVSFAGDEY